jgi:precorrin-6B methylase 2
VRLLKMTAARTNVTYLSAPAAVSMADRWFEIASVDHFWIRRRFEVLRRLAGPLIASAGAIAEIGCGHGLLQLQIERAYDREVTGFDLNEFALKQSVSRFSPVCCYDIFQRDSALRGRFDLIFLFDVLEHIAKEGPFLEAVLFHLATNGKIVVNVPAGETVYSAYDRAAGHMRRYSIKTLRDAARRSDLEIGDWTYWGLPLIPTLVLRKLWLMGRHNDDEIIREGFDSRGRFANRLLGLLSGFEVIPQKLAGSSLMAVLGHARRP